MRFTERPAAGGNARRAGRRMTTLLTMLSALPVLAMLCFGCSGGSSKTVTPPAQPDGPQTYMAPYVVGDLLPGFSLSDYKIDDTAQSFSKSTYYVGKTGPTGTGPLQLGAQTFYAGTTATLKRGLLSLVGTDAGPQPQPGSWAVELPNQAGGLVQILGQPVEPIVAATSCPDFKTAQTYQFLTLPAPFPSGQAEPFSWDPTQETVFGSVDVSGSGSTITFNNIQQYALPSFPDMTPGAPVTSATSPQTGTCSSGYYGSTTVVPGDLTVTDPGPPNSVAPPVAVVGIGPTGLLIESNAALGEPTVPPFDTPPFYQTLLGAGTGAIGLPKPSSALDTSALLGAQYLGFMYGTGLYDSGGNGSAGCGSSGGWSSCVASFGFNTLPASCSTVIAQTSTMIYGGDFGTNNPASAGVQNNGGFGSCDMAIDLGTQDPNNNGLYPAAQVWLGTSFAGNGLGIPYSVQAVAIAGQLGGRYAIFLLGFDTTGTVSQAWGIYLLQSNGTK